MIKTKIVSSLEKAFIDEKIDKFEALESISVLRGERFSLQLLYTYEPDEGEFYQRLVLPKFEGPMAKYVKLHNVQNVPVVLPVVHTKVDDNYLRTTPGLYPDVLEPVHYEGCFRVRYNNLDSLWMEFNIPEDCAEVGESELKLTLINTMDETVVGEHTVKIDLIDAALPEQTLRLTQWFHCDCLAQYYNVPVWSEKHWEIIENFARVAVKNGINMLLTPVFTPPLDTKIGGERLTTQLVGIKKSGNRYTFNWKLLDRWVEMCDRIGIKYFEISHLFSQWGAIHAPKIMVTEDGEYKRLFGWDTDAHGEEYKRFIRTFVKAFLKHAKERGFDHRCYFHISDEPNVEQLENYKKSSKIVANLLKDYPIMDALSNFDFWKKGVVKTPIPSNNHVAPFIEAKVPNLWTYYCCGQCVNVSNRLISMPSWRNRSIGMQMYKYNIVGFLQWGYNFYNNCSSVDALNPFLDVSGEKWVPAGDTCSVYPAQNGECIESLRILVFQEGLTDMRAMQLAESYYSHDEVVAAIEAAFGREITFDTCAYSAKEMLAVREAVNKMIKAAIAK